MVVSMLSRYFALRAARANSYKISEVFIRTLSGKVNSETPINVNIQKSEKSNKSLTNSLLDIVKKEIEDESTVKYKANIPEGWKYELIDNDAILTKKHEIENIEVKFNILETDHIPLANEDFMEEDASPDDEITSQFVCTPVLTVKVSREGKGCIELKLRYTEDEDIEQDGFNEEDDADDMPIDEESYDSKPRRYDDEHPLSFKVKNNMWVDIESIGMKDINGKNIYEFTSDMFDYEFGLGLVEFLSIRGVDVEFLNSVMDLASKVDSQQYVTFLNGLHSFLKK